MGQRSKIDWCDSSWNPVTGCLHGCEYCYARRMAERFGGCDPESAAKARRLDGGLMELDEPARITWAFSGKTGWASFPFGFTPTLHRYKLGELAHWKKPRTIFVGSIADLFGAWVPEAWIEGVFEACKAAPWHRYLFLTKNPGRLHDLARRQALPRGEHFWYGSTTTKPDAPFFYSDVHNTFVSIEPIQERFGNWGPARGQLPGWIIIGAETGSRREQIIPEKAWVAEIAGQARENGIPVFMKESLRGIMGEEFRQEFPW